MSAVTTPLTVYGLDGTVLLGPGLHVNATDCIGNIKHRLHRRHVKVRLFWKDTELFDEECLAGRFSRGSAPDVELTAVMSHDVSAELAAITFVAQERHKHIQESSRQWLQELGSADEQRKIQEREKDVCEYERALADMVAHLGEMAIANCKLAAMNRQSRCRFDFEHEVPVYDLGSRICLHRERPIRSDPVMRGWYFSSEAPDALDTPEFMVMGDGMISDPRPRRRYSDFIRDVIRPRLKMTLSEKGLRIRDDTQLIHAIVIEWSSP